MRSRGIGWSRPASRFAVSRPGMSVGAGPRLGLGLALGVALGLGLSGSLPGTTRAQSMPAGRPDAASPGLRAGGRLGPLVLSALCPGLGHLKQGHRQRALPYLIAEGAIWTVFGFSEVQGDWRRDSYIQQAELEAGVRAAQSQSDSYFRLIGIWPSSDLYNELIRREARALYPDDLGGRAAYFESNRVSDDIAWSWESQAAWDRYREKRSDSRRAFRRGRYMLGLAVANRAVAMIDATLLAHGEKGERALRLEMVPGGEPGAASIQLSWLLP